MTTHRANALQLTSVEVTSTFWNRYRSLVAEQVIPYQWSVINDAADIDIAADPGSGGLEARSNAIANLRIAAGRLDGHHYGYVFQDTDVYKWLEAASYTLRYHPSDDLRTITDSVVDLIADAQDDDGYLSTYFQIDAPERKFHRLQQSHELYSMGHYIEAGVAYHEVTGNVKALGIARRMADCIGQNLGVGDGKVPGYDGHPEIELALARLYEATHEQRYLDLAHYFLTQRGQDPDFFDRQNEADGLERDFFEAIREMPRTYYQAAEPITDQRSADGHAVRVGYLCTGLAHVARLTGDQELLSACRRLWADIVHRRMYITGAIGSTTIGESFTYDYDLPNDTVYGETCASVSMAFFARRMLDLDANGEYADILEKELFNGIISGLALDGQHFFYVNPLQADPASSRGNPTRSHVRTRRAAWFGVACCPANLARLIASVDQYLYTVRDDVILAHQFISNDASFSNGVTISQHSDFPWNGRVQYTIEVPDGANARLGIRIPAWSASRYTISVDGHSTDRQVIDGFVYFDLEAGTTQIDLSLDMSVKFFQANNRVEIDAGQVAVQRGPVVYCAEEADNTAPLWLSRITRGGDKLVYHYEDQLLGGVGVIDVSARREAEDPDVGPLYREAHDRPTEHTQLRLVPYYSWANREEGQMRVWLPTQ